MGNKNNKSSLHKDLKEYLTTETEISNETFLVNLKKKYAPTKLVKPTKLKNFLDTNTEEISNSIVQTLLSKVKNKKVTCFDVCFLHKIIPIDEEKSNLIKIKSTFINKKYDPKNLNFETTQVNNFYSKQIYYLTTNSAFTFNLNLSKLSRFSFLDMSINDKSDKNDDKTKDSGLISQRKSNESVSLKNEILTSNEDKLNTEQSIKYVKFINLSKTAKININKTLENEIDSKRTVGKLINLNEEIIKVDKRQIPSANRSINKSIDKSLNNSMINLTKRDNTNDKNNFSLINDISNNIPYKKKIGESRISKMKSKLENSKLNQTQVLKESKRSITPNQPKQSAKQPLVKIKLNMKDLSKEEVYHQYYYNPNKSFKSTTMNEHLIFKKEKLGNIKLDNTKLTPITLSHLPEDTSFIDIVDILTYNNNPRAKSGLKSSSIDFKQKEQKTRDIFSQNFKLHNKTVNEEQYSVNDIYNDFNN